MNKHQWKTLYFLCLFLLGLVSLELPINSSGLSRVACIFMASIGATGWLMCWYDLIFRKGSPPKQLSVTYSEDTNMVNLCKADGEVLAFTPEAARKLAKVLMLGADKAEGLTQDHN